LLDKVTTRRLVPVPASCQQPSQALPSHQCKAARDTHFLATGSTGTPGNSSCSACTNKLGPPVPTPAPPEAPHPREPDRSNREVSSTSNVDGVWSEI
jgi:hypothetical protein